MRKRTAKGPPALRCVDFGTHWDGPWYTPEGYCPGFLYPDTPATRLFFRQGGDWPYRMAVVLVSDVPLDEWTRTIAARLLRGLHSPPTRHQVRLRQQRALVEEGGQMREALKAMGHSATDAEAIVAKSAGMSVEALRKQVQRARKQLRQAK